MQHDGLLAGIVLGDDPSELQAVDVTPDMREWCRRQAATIHSTDAPYPASAIDWRSLLALFASRCDVKRDIGPRRR